ncbi:hypothetical protein HY501_02770, partial [Candidatus Woesearchaeota archaeon]|nr:hypothetical protein [Candidatus Woesearchaeota archaeon]
PCDVPEGWIKIEPVIIEAYEEQSKLSELNEPPRAKPTEEKSAATEKTEIAPIPPNVQLPAAPLEP